MELEFKVMMGKELDGIPMCIDSIRSDPNEFDFTVPNVV